MLTRSLFTVAMLVCAMPALADQKSESMAADILDSRMQNQRPEDYKLLRGVQDRNIVVVRGSMDHIEQVLAAARIRHTVINPEEVAGYDLNADMIVMVNCPGHMPDAGVRRIEKFVRAGGLLYTTDWALMNVVQKAFPRTIKASGASTGDHVTPVHVHKNDDNLMSNMLLSKGSAPQWWLEGGSYPIQILDTQRVQVLASSDEMGRLYGSKPVVVRFRWEDGEVIHVVSHFYRQVGTRTNAVATKEAIKNVDGLSAAQKQQLQAAPEAQASMGDVESSYAFQQMTSNLIVEKAKQNKDLDQSYKATPKRSVSVEGRQVKPGERLKVLKREGNGKARVRDDRGNEAVVDEADLMAR